jgi:hypothetical protein
MTTVLDTPLTTDALAADLATLRGQWMSLTELIEGFAPGVVVLIARKTPRLFEVFGMGLPANPLVISDLAIPMSERYLAGARVAVIDDVVNVGSTIRRTARLVEAAGAREVEMFAISRLQHEEDGHESLADGDIASLQQPRYAEPSPLDRAGLMEFASRVPEALEGLAKPYDMDFPVMQCRLETPYDGFEELLLALVERYGEDTVYDLSTPRGQAAGIRRLAIDVPCDGGAHGKLRIYFNEHDRLANLVPIMVAGTLDEEPRFTDVWASAIWRSVHGELARAAEHNTASELVPARRDAAARLRLFVDSLHAGRAFLADNRDLLRPASETPFNLNEAQLTLGPIVHRVQRHLQEPLESKNEHSDTPAPAAGTPAPATSPFLMAARANGLVQQLQSSSPSTDTLSLFISLFEVLADAVGVNDPDNYQLGWPYSNEQILENPYLRLRIGPTVPDIIALIDDAREEANPPGQTRWEVTRLLDRFIDFGSVVPTTAEYGGSIYRIYRKGERQPRVIPADRLLNAWRSYNEPLSLTRVSKLAAFLAFSVNGDSAVTVRAQTRGNTLCFAPSVLHEETEVSHYLRNTKQLKPA